MKALLFTPLLFLTSCKITLDPDTNRPVFGLDGRQFADFIGRKVDRLNDRINPTVLSDKP